MGIAVDPNARGLIFDMDGTLSDSLPVHLETWNRIGKTYGFQFDPGILLEMTGRPTIEFANRIIKQYNLEESPEKLVRIKQESFWELSHLLTPIDKVVKIVKEYHGRLPMAVGTGASRRSAEVQLAALRLTDYFEVIVSADDVTCHKPEPETFTKCARIMGIDPEYCQVFEDGELGLEAARKANMIVTDVRSYINYGKWALSQHSSR